MILAGDIQAVRSLSVLGAIPFAAVMVLQIVALLRALRFDEARYLAERERARSWP
jgi:glycine betaine transporter